ncbi:SIS domain-containing protein [Rhizobium sp. RCAM05973]|uniref:SIS domain-containing protein n=1 Tax=Rhizobium sp. RCAM05973 TaxID=2994066 RepID=UPI0022EC1687
MNSLEAKNGLHWRVIEEIAASVDSIDADAIDRTVELIAMARHVSVFGCGREGLQIRGFAMRLFHMGRAVSVVGEMVTPAIGHGDLFLVVAGPGTLSTASALVGVARASGALVLTITAQPQGPVPQGSDEVLVLPAQTMANDQGEAKSAMAMGSVFEGALFVLFEVMTLKLKDRLGVSDADMRKNHTNLE